MVFSSGASLGKSLAKATGEVARSVDDATTDPGNVREYADAFQAAFDRQADVLRRYANDRIDDPGATTVAVGFTDRQGNDAVRYLAAESAPGTDVLTDLRVVGPERFAEMDRAVDERVDADWYLSRHAADELRAFVDEYARRDRDPPRSYVAKTAAKYGDSVDDELVDRAVDALLRSFPRRRVTPGAPPS
jgi:hypothetical protein